MTLHVSYHPDTTAELRADLAWYEQRHANLGDRFERGPRGKATPRLRTDVLRASR